MKSPPKPQPTAKRDPKSAYNSDNWMVERYQEGRDQYEWRAPTPEEMRAAKNRAKRNRRALR